jgi:hypothetical protein
LNCGRNAFISAGAAAVSVVRRGPAPSRQRGDLMCFGRRLWCGRNNLLVKIDAPWSENNVGDVGELDRKGFMITAVVPSINSPRPTSLR